MKTTRAASIMCTPLAADARARGPASDRICPEYPACDRLAAKKQRRLARILSDLVNSSQRRAIRQRQRFHRQHELGGVWAVCKNRVLHQRWRGISQQRRARRDDYGTPTDGLADATKASKFLSRPGSRGSDGAAAARPRTYQFQCRFPMLDSQSEICLPACGKTKDSRRDAAMALSGTTIIGRLSWLSLEGEIRTGTQCALSLVETGKQTALYVSACRVFPPPDRNARDSVGNYIPGAPKTLIASAGFRLGEKIGCGFRRCAIGIFRAAAATEDNAFVSPATGASQRATRHRLDNGMAGPADAVNLLTATPTRVPMPMVACSIGIRCLRMCFPTAGRDPATAAV